MAAPSTANELLELIRKSRIVTDESLQTQTNDAVPEKAVDFAAKLVKSGLITPFQAKLLLGGRYRGFRLGAYIIREQIGQGGMGTVYLAEHETLRRRVAVKVLSPQEGGKRVAVERFLREARAAAALDHPNIVRIFDVAQQGDLYYLVMEYVEGETLDEVVEKHGPLPCGRAAEYVLQAAAGLDHANSKGFIHRDIKPGNLILAKDGTLKILDMGLARSFETNDKLTEVFDNGSVVGTADYIAPEQAMNNPDLDIRADIYSLGATFFAIVTGRPPFEGNTTQKLLQHQLKEAPSIMLLDKTFPPGLGEVLSKMLKKKPNERYQTPAEVMAALGPWLPNNARVVAALSRTNLGSSLELQQTLNDIVTGSTSRLPKLQPPEAIEQEATRKPSRTVLWVCLGLLGLAAVAAGIGAALYQTNEVATDASKPPAYPAKSEDVATTTSTPVKPDGQADSRNPVVATPIPAAVPSPRVAYELDLTKAKPFRELGMNVPSAPGKQPAMVWTVIEKSGVGPLPSGWHTRAWKNADIIETTITEVDGRPAISMKGYEGAKSGMLFTNRVDFQSAKLELRFEYAAEGTNGNAHVRFVAINPKREEAVNLVKMPATNGKISHVEVDWDLEGATAGSFEFHTGSLEQNRALQILGMEVIETGSEARKPLIQLDLRSIQPFSVTTTTVSESGTRKLKTLSESGKVKLPTSWYRWIEHPDTTVEYFVESSNGKSALGLRNLSGKPGAYFTSPEVGFKGKVELRIGYQSGAPGLIRFRPSDKKPSFDAVKLPIVTDGWMTLTQEIDLNTHASGVFEIATNGMGEDGALKLREFQVYAKE